MKILDFFKRKEKEEPKIKKVINFENLNQLIENNTLEFKNKKTEVYKIVKSHISRLSEDYNKNKLSFKNIDWEKMKVEERIKQIVRENLINYESHLNKLIEELNNLEEYNLNKEKIYSIFSIFEKRATISYQKSTYLIGKEMEEINKSMLVFFKNIEKTYDENKDFIYKTEILSDISKNQRELEELNKNISQIKYEINQTEKIIDNLENELKNQNNAINNIKKEKIYIEWIQKNEKFNDINKKLNEEIQNLQNIIDFKALARIWHENHQEMNILKEYRSNFGITFNKDKGEILTRLTNLLQNKENIHDLISKINCLEKEIKNINIENSPSLNIEREIQKTSEEILSLKDKKFSENKKIDKLTLSIKPIINKMTQNLSIINLNITFNF